MIVDTSALLAILLHENEGDTFGLAISRSLAPAMSAGSLLELHAILTRRFRGELDDAAERMLGMLAIAIAPVTADQAAIARDAYRRYGIGTGHPARLNFGDCFAYALAKTSGQPLLFKGDNFGLTDIAIAAC